MSPATVDRLSQLWELQWEVFRAGRDSARPLTDALTAPLVESYRALGFTEAEAQSDIRRYYTAGRGVREMGAAE